MYKITTYPIMDTLKIPIRKLVDNKTHIKEAIKWIYRAQDASPDRGVCHSYHLFKGWTSSYPETTGYIIPTLLNWALLNNDNEAEQRAIEMADWEIDIQMENGAIQGNVMSLPKKNPVIFDTAQVLFGWLSAYNYSGSMKYLNAAKKAADWLIYNLDENHIWSSYGNPGAKTSIHTYNARCAWAVLELYKKSNEKKHLEPMRDFLDWVLTQEVRRGWFKNNCLNNNNHPLLHTIAYTNRGLLESGMILSEEKYINASIRTSDELIKHISKNGKMPGRFDQNWQPSIRWSCLTGMAQMSIVWNKLFKYTGKTEYKKAYEKVNYFLKRTQDITINNPGIKGGIKGSHPIKGGYCPYRILNWATKFFIDALLLEECPEEKFGII